MRRIEHPDEFTDFGRWINRKCKQDELSVTNLDYVLEDYSRKRLMLFEEKTRGGRLHPAQRKTFKILDRMLRSAAATDEYDYWGFYLLVLPAGKSEPCEGMTLNRLPISEAELIDHMNFDKRFCEPMDLSDPTFTTPGLDEWWSSL